MIVLFLMRYPYFRRMLGGYDDAYAFCAHLFGWPLLAVGLLCMLFATDAFGAQLSFGLAATGILTLILGPWFPLLETLIVVTMGLAYMLSTYFVPGWVAALELLL